MSDASAFISWLLSYMMQIIGIINVNWVLQLALAVFVFVLAFRLVKKYLLH